MNQVIPAENQWELPVFLDWTVTLGRRHEACRGVNMAGTSSGGRNGQQPLTSPISNVSNLIHPCAPTGSRCPHVWSAFKGKMLVLTLRPRL